MPKYVIEDIKIVVADKNQQLRAGLKGVLSHYGFRNILDAQTVKGLEEVIRIASPDMILCDIDMEGGDVCKLIRRLRHNEVGQNPFSSVILFIEEPNADTVRRAAEAGIDDLQVKPVVAQNVINRFEYLIEKRKPFVVTTDYVGPDRRKSHRAGTMEIPLVHVPNTLASKAKGKFNPRLVNDEIQKALWNVNAQKIERHVFQVGYLLERILPAYKDGAINRESLGMVVRLVKVSEDIVDRLEDSDFGHISDLAGTLATVARSLWESGTDPKIKDLELLPELSAALSATFNMDATSSSVVQKIKSSVQEKYNH